MTTNWLASDWGPIAVGGGGGVVSATAAGDGGDAEDSWPPIGSNNLDGSVGQSVRGGVLDGSEDL